MENVIGPICCFRDNYRSAERYSRLSIHLLIHFLWLVCFITYSTLTCQAFSILVTKWTEIAFFCFGGGIPPMRLAATHPPGWLLSYLYLFLAISLKRPLIKWLLRVKPFRASHMQTRMMMMSFCGFTDIDFKQTASFPMWLILRMMILLLRNYYVFTITVILFYFAHAINILKVFDLVD